MDLPSAGVKPRRKELFDVWRSTSQKKRLKSAIDFLKPFYTNQLLNDEDEKQFIAFIKKECEKIRQKWVEKRRRLDLFRKFYGHWLEEEIIYEKKCPISRRSPTPNVGRPKKTFENSSIKSKRRKAKRLIETYDHEELTLAVQMSTRACGKRDTAALIKKVAEASPKRAKTYKSRLQIIEADPKLRPYTNDEALALFISNKFTVQQYKNMQQEAKERGFNLYPSYDSILKAKQNCHPSVEHITVTDISAKVKLQPLLDHTASRLCKDVLKEVFLRSDIQDPNYTLIYKWGCDGSSGHSLYKQPFENPENTDEYMFIISMVPLRLIETGTKKLIWQNPRPSSPRYCRIMKFVFKMESTDLIQNECDDIKKEIENLTPTKVIIDDKTITVTHSLILSMIDGKVCNVLSGNKSTQKCYICKAVGKDLNAINVMRTPDTDMYKFGISPLHARLRTMECLLNVAYRLDIKVWQVRGNDKKVAFKKRKEDIIKKFKDVGLIIDKVKPGFGTSNDGNTARRFFKDSQATANITGVDKTLIYRLSIILRLLSSEYEIDPQKFQEYCDDTRILYLNLYSWYIMPVTLHKILIHGAEIIKNCIIPIGQMSEEASEGQNKEIRKVRSGHTCKISRVRSNFDLLKYLLLCSDPYITQLCKLKKKKVTKCNKDFLQLLK
ncbi:hypothetical protein ACJJTC_016128 [Scirpophaga incertulas]